MDTQPAPNRLSRRKLFQWCAAVAAADVASSVLPAFAQTAAAPVVGYGTDPVLNAAYAPGDFWDLTLTEAERKATIALADMILPADDFGPAASDLHLVDFIDEWVSAPYPRQVSDRDVILPGLKWLDEEAQSRHQKTFSDLSENEKSAICDDLCSEKPATPELAKAARFFSRFTSLSTGAYYNTPEGWAAIGYVGNTPSGIFAGPPQDVLDQLGLEQTVKDEDA